MSITSDEINYLIFRYLQENGFNHSAFTFAYESLVSKSTAAQVQIPPGALITFLQKGLEYVGIEEHLNDDGSIREVSIIIVVVMLYLTYLLYLIYLFQFFTHNFIFLKILLFFLFHYYSCVL